LFGFQKLGMNKNNSVKISSLPIIIKNESTNLSGGVNTAKLPDPPTSPKAMPVFEIIAIAEEKVVCKSSP